MTTIKRLRELLAKATPGPWTSHGYDEWVSWNIRDCYGNNLRGLDRLPKDTAALIVAMRNHLPALLDVVEAARVQEHGLPNYTLFILKDALAKLDNVTG